MRGGEQARAKEGFHRNIAKRRSAPYMNSPYVPFDGQNVDRYREDNLAEASSAGCDEDAPLASSPSFAARLLLAMRSCLGLKGGETVTAVVHTKDSLMASAAQTLAANAGDSKVRRAGRELARSIWHAYHIRP